MDWKRKLSANVADAYCTSVIRLDALYFRTLSLHIEYISGLFYALIYFFKLSLGITKLKPRLNAFVCFEYRNIAIVFIEKVLRKHSMVIFDLVKPPKKFEKSIVAPIDISVVV